MLLIILIRNVILPYSFRYCSSLNRKEEIIFFYYIDTNHNKEKELLLIIIIRNVVILPYSFRYCSSLEYKRKEETILFIILIYYGKEDKMKRISQQKSPFDGEKCE